MSSHSIGSGACEALSSSSAQPRRVWPAELGCLLGAYAVLLIGNVLAFVVRQADAEHVANKALVKFDFDEEAVLPAWFSATLLLLCGLLALGIWKQTRARVSDAWRWCVAGVLLVAMSADESTSIHEMLGQGVNLILPTSGLLHFAWLLLALPLLLAAVVVFLPWLWRQPASLRWGLLLWTGVYFMGCIGFEMISGPIAETQGLESPAFFVAYTIEESLEMFGLIGVLLVLRAYSRGLAADNHA